MGQQGRTAFTSGCYEEIGRILPPQAMSCGIEEDLGMLRGDLEAILRRLAELRRDRLYAAYEAAASDPAFVADMEEVTRSFEPAVTDGLRG